MPLSRRRRVSNHLHTQYGWAGMTTQILLIDPDIAFMVTLKQALESTAEFRVNIAANAAAAIDLLRNTSYDAAVADFELPELDTLELLQGLRQVQRALPVLMMAHSELHFERVRFLDVQGAIGKPFTARELIPYLRRIIDRAQPTITPPSVSSAGADEFVPPQMPRSVQQLMDNKTTASPTELLDDVERSTFADESDLDAATPPDTGTFNLSGDDLLAEFEAMERSHAGEPEDSNDAPADQQPPAEHFGTTILDREPDSSATTALEWPEEPETTRRLPSEPEPSDTTALLEWQTPEETRKLAETDNLDTLISKHGWGIRQKPDTKPLHDRPGAPGRPPSEAGPQDPNARFYDTDDSDSRDFGDVLSAVAQSQPDDYRRPPGERAFHDLVDSLGVGDQALPRRTRLEDLLTSIAADAGTGGEPVNSDNTLDYVLDAIRRSADIDPAPPLPQPPPPEESELDDTTIGDVIEGLFDPGFEGVLAALAGEEIGDENYDEPTYAGLDRITATLEPRADDRIGLDAMQTDTDVPDWLTGINAGEDSHTVVEEPSFSEDDSRHYRATAALNAVQGTEDEIDFSLHQLLDQIESELPPARTRYPVLKPLPSWGEDGPITGGEDVAALFTRMESGHDQADPFGDGPVAPGTLPASIARLLPDPLNEPPVSAQDTRPTQVVRAQREAEAGESGLAEGDDEDFEDVWAMPDTMTTPAPASGWERPGDYPDALRDLASDVEPPAPPSRDPGDMFSMDEFFALADLPIEAGTEEIKRPHDPDHEELYEAVPYDEPDTPDEGTFTAAFYAGLHESAMTEEHSPLEAPPDERTSSAETIEPAATFEDEIAYDMPWNASYDAAHDSVADADSDADAQDAAYPTAYEPEEASWPAEPAPLDALGSIDWYAEAPDLAEQPEDDTRYDERYDNRSYDTEYADQVDHQRDDFAPSAQDEDADDDSPDWLQAVGLPDLTAASDDQFTYDDAAPLVYSEDEPPAWDDDQAAQPESPPDSERYVAAPAEPISESDAEAEEADLAQIAILLTQYALDSSAQATLLSRRGMLLARAGNLPSEAMDRLFQIVDTAWQTRSGESNALMRFITLPEVGDFLLYSKQVDYDLLLSMVFNANTSVRMIRRQARRLSESLSLVPENGDSSESVPTDAPAAQTLVNRPTDLHPPAGLREATADHPLAAGDAPAPSEAQEDPGPYRAYTCLWVPAHAGLEIEGDLASDLYQWIHDVAEGQTWGVEDLEVRPDYVALTLKIPQKTLPDNAIQYMISETAMLSRQYYRDLLGGGPLWADGYTVIAPPRALGEREIARFVTVVQQPFEG